MHDTQQSGILGFMICMDLMRVLMPPNYPDSDADAADTCAILETAET